MMAASASKETDKPVLQWAKLLSFNLGKELEMKGQPNTAENIHFGQL